MESLFEADSLIRTDSLKSAPVCIGIRTLVIQVPSFPRQAIVG